MAHSKQAAEEGSLLEYALRRIRLNMEESPMACRWVEGGGSWHKVAPFNVDVKGRRMVDMWASGGWEQVELRERPPWRIPRGMVGGARDGLNSSPRPLLVAELRVL